jgi:hypothetical protein
MANLGFLLKLPADFAVTLSSADIWELVERYNGAAPNPAKVSELLSGALVDGGGSGACPHLAALIRLLGAAAADAAGASGSHSAAAWSIADVALAVRRVTVELRAVELRVR